MKDQYFGDVNDYRKYGLLRVLQAGGSGTMLVAWMLTRNDGSRDGRKRAYLEEPRRWAHHDPVLYHGLASLLGAAPYPSVSLLETSDLLPRTSYHSAVVPDEARERERWREGLLHAAADADLVFFDPDNGIEVPSKPIGRRDSSKYVAWSEIEALWSRGSSVLVYQHFPRVSRTAFIGRCAAAMRARTGARTVGAFVTAHVLFLLAARGLHARRLRANRSRIERSWRGQIRWIG